MNENVLDKCYADVAEECKRSIRNGGMKENVCDSVECSGSCQSLQRLMEKDFEMRFVLLAYPERKMVYTYVLF
jgi:hypothetical protein